VCEEEEGGKEDVDRKENAGKGLSKSISVLLVQELECAAGCAK
jgi:hypothetical protein